MHTMCAIKQHVFVGNQLIGWLIGGLIDVYHASTRPWCILYKSIQLPRQGRWTWNIAADHCYKMSRNSRCLQLFNGKMSKYSGSCLGWYCMSSRGCLTGCQFHVSQHQEHQELGMEVLLEVRKMCSMNWSYRSVKPLDYRNHWTRCTRTGISKQSQLEPFTWKWQASAAPTILMGLMDISYRTSQKPMPSTKRGPNRVHSQNQLLCASFCLSLSSQCDKCAT